MARAGLMVLAAAAAALAGFWVARELDSSGPQLASGTWLARPRTLASFELLDGAGHAVGRKALEGKASLLFFGFTHCPDVCPTTLAKLARVVKAAPVAPLQVLFVTVDPERDTPQVVQAYAHAFDPSFIGLTGAPVAITRLARELGVAVSRVDLPGGDYTMDHSAVLYLLDARGNAVAVFTPPFDPEQLTADLIRARKFLQLGS